MTTSFSIDKLTKKQKRPNLEKKLYEDSIAEDAQVGSNITEKCYNLNLYCYSSKVLKFILKINKDDLISSALIKRFIEDNNNKNLKHHITNNKFKIKVMKDVKNNTDFLNQNYLCETPLFHACRSGNKELVEYFNNLLVYVKNLELWNSRSLISGFYE
ncbi:hypothetical protein H8356DRAFT_1362894 [Neocallimastix lanati (nom. inval.)]|nr:hypothetical protein H8356DRAFT_1362894 [Neocallimastix sp. JGI-2020a]